MIHRASLFDLYPQRRLLAARAAREIAARRGIWTIPRTWSPGELVTALMMNTHVRDNFNIVKISLDDNGHLVHSQFQVKNGAYYATVTDDVINCVSGTFPVVLYPAASAGKRQLIVKNSGAGTITVLAGAIVFDGATAGGFGSSVTSFTHTHQCGSNANYLLAGVFGGAADDITGVTYNSIAMTQLAKFLGGGNDMLYIYGLANPPTGSALNVTASASSSTIIGLEMASYAGMALSPLDTTQTNHQASSTSLAITNTPSVPGCWLLNFTRGVTGGGTWSASGIATRISGTTEFANLGDTNGIVSGPVTVTVSTTGAAQQFDGIQVSLKPYANQTLDGGTSLTLAAGASALLVADGANWWVAAVK